MIALVQADGNEIEATISEFRNSPDYVLYNGHLYTRESYKRFVYAGEPATAYPSDRLKAA